MYINYNNLFEDGCIIIPDLIGSATISDFHLQIEDFATAMLKRRGKQRKASDAMTDLLTTGGEYRRVLFPLLVGFQPLRQIQVQVLDWLQSSAFCERAGIEVPTITFALKADVPGEMKYLLPLHQDYGTPTHRAYRIWIALRDACPENGTMRYVAGSHKAGFIDHDVSNPELPQVPSDMYGAEQFQLLEFPAGSAFLFHPLLVHASVPASEDRMKYALIVNVWDLAALADPEDETDPINKRVKTIQERNRVRGDRDPIKFGARS